MSIIGNNNSPLLYPSFVVDTFTTKVANLSDLENLRVARDNLGIAGHEDTLNIKGFIGDNLNFDDYTETGIYLSKEGATNPLKVSVVYNYETGDVYQNIVRADGSGFTHRVRRNGVWKQYEVSSDDALYSKFANKPNGLATLDSNSKIPIAQIPKNGVQSVGVSVPIGFTVEGSPITDSGTFDIKYASGYRGYTNAESNKLSGIEDNADVTTANLVASKFNEISASGLPNANDGFNMNSGNTAKRVLWSTVSSHLLSRANHTGTQSIETISGLQGALDSKATKEQGEKADTAVSFINQNLTEAEKSQARNNIGAFSSSGGSLTGLLTTRSDNDNRILLSGIGEFPDVVLSYSNVGNLGFYDSSNKEWIFRIDYPNRTIHWKGGILAGGDGNINGDIWSSLFGGSNGWAAQAIKGYVDDNLSKKADTTWTTNQLNSKANLSAVNDQLALKANISANIFNGDQEIRTSNPKIHFISSNTTRGYTITANVDNTNDYGFRIQAGYQGGYIFTALNNGNVSILGSLSAASKNFITDHPLDPFNKDLVYVSTESPSHGIEYWGSIKLVNGRATVDVDSHYGMMQGTFQAMTKDAIIFLQNQDSSKSVYRKWNDDGTFDIICDDSNCDDLIGWQVKGIRKDIGIYSLANTDPETGKHIPEQDKPEYEEVI